MKSASPFGNKQQQPGAKAMLVVLLCAAQLFIVAAAFFLSGKATVVFAAALISAIVSTAIALVVLALLRPLLGLTMVEARARKAAFLREVIRELALPDTAVVNERFETLEARTDLSGGASLVTVRAVRVDLRLLSVSHHLLRTGGKLFLLGKGEAAPRGGLSRYTSVETVELPVGSGSRLIIATV